MEYWVYNTMSIFQIHTYIYKHGFIVLCVFFKSSHPKFKLLLAVDATFILSVDGLGITWRPGDIFFTSHASEVGLMIQNIK